MAPVWKILKNLKNLFLYKIKLFNEAYGEYRGRILLIGFLGIVSSFVESIGITTVVPVFSFAMGDGSFLGNDSVFRIVNLVFDYFNVEYRFRFLLIFICVLFVFRFLFILATKYLSISIASKYEEETRKRTFLDTINTNWGYLLGQKLGHLENVLMIDIGQSRILFEKIADVFVIIGSLAVYIFIALKISAAITGLTLLFGVAVFIGLYPFVKKTQATAQERMFFKKKIAHQVNQHTLGMKTVKAMNLTRPISRIVGEYFTKHRRLQIRLFLLHQASVSAVEPLALIYIVGVFAYLYLQPNFNMGVFVVFVFLIYRIFQYVMKLQSAAHLVNETTQHLRTVLEYGRKAEKYKETATGDQAFSFSDSLILNNLSFSYPERGAVLSDLNLTIKKGEMVGIVGPSGSGKTTIADLLLRLFKPTAGAIEIDGRDIQTIRLDSWRDSIGYLSQDIFLTNDTIRNNISFYAESISEADIIAAAKMAHIYDVVQEFPNGFDTIIGERGIELSVGQRQRIAIARVLARRPKILILDEATSALDNESEQAVQKIIEKFHKEITIIVIAHRLTTVLDCDRIVSLKNGEIAESGHPQELLNNPDSYFYKSFHLKD